MTNNTRAACWILIDMCLHTSVLVLVKSIGADYPTIQIVFIRAATGMILLLPWVVSAQSSFTNITDWPLHIGRVFLSTLALSCGYYAVAHVPLALFTAFNYLRPAMLMIMATLLLGEFIGMRRWAAVALGFIGVLIALQPSEYSFSTGIGALIVAVFAGSAATILLRRLKGNPEIVMLIFYTLGITLFSAPVAFVQWVPIASEDIIALVAIGILAQCAQLCFLRAHWLGEVGFLGPIGYVSLLLSAGAGYLFFNETLTVALVVGATIILMSAALLRQPQSSANAGSP